jgi:hypothetical protein
VNWTQGPSVTDFWGEFTSFAASIRDPNLVLYGGFEAHRSTNGGQTFSKINN